jgi:proteic killer suppression protein
MNLVFASRRLEQCYENGANAVRAWGPQVGRRYIQRINLLYAVRSFDELFNFQALRLHPLRGPRAEEWAMTLQGRWRLIIELLSEDTILVKEVSHHYGD